MMVWTIEAERPVSPRARLSCGNPPFVISVESFILVIKATLVPSLAASYIQQQLRHACKSKSHPSISSA